MLLSTCRWLSRVAVLAAVLLIAATGTDQVRATTSPASHPVQVRIRALAGSNKYLVFSRFTVQASGQEAKYGDLYVMDRSGRTRKLGHTERNHAPIDYPTLSGNIVYDARYDADHFALFNLRTGTRKVFVDAFANRTYPIAAAPGGYLAIAQTGSSDAVISVSWSGRVTKRGGPFDDCRDVDLETGPTAFIAEGAGDDPFESGCDVNDNGVTVQRFDAPGKYRTLGPPNADIGCGPPGPKDVMCADGNGDCTVLHYRLTGRLISRFTVASLNDCPASGFVTQRGHSFWLNSDPGSGTHGNLYELSGHTLTHSRSEYSDNAGPVPAFGKIVVTTPGGRHLVELASAHGTPHRLI
jgi:hypothetical protein